MCRRRFVAALMHERIVGVGCGRSHTVACSREGLVYACGSAQVRACVRACVSVCLSVCLCVCVCVCTCTLVLLLRIRTLARLPIPSAAFRSRDPSGFHSFPPSCVGTDNPV